MADRRLKDRPRRKSRERRPLRPTSQGRNVATGWKAIYGKLKNGEVAERTYEFPGLPLHRLLVEAAAFAWQAEITCEDARLRLRLRKKGKSFSFSPSMANSGGVAAFLVAPDSIYLVNLALPSRVSLRLKCEGGRPLNLSCPGIRIPMEVGATADRFEVATSPVSLLPGGYHIQVITDSSPLRITAVRVESIRSTGLEHARGLPPDQYRRFRVASEAALAVAGPDARCLDVGGGDGGLAAFLPGVATLDPKFLDRSSHTTGSVLEAGLPASDVVCLIDTLEHLPAGDRPQALSRVCKAATRSVIICAPFAGPERDQAEAYVASFSRRIAAGEHPHLREHSEYGLPDLAATISFLRSQGFHCAEMGFFQLSSWAFLSALTTYLDRDPQFLILEQAFFEFVNRRFPCVGTERTADAYETLIVASRSPLPPRFVEGLRERLDRRASDVGAVPDETLPILLETILQGRLLEKDSEIGRLSNRIAELHAGNAQIERLIRELSEDRDNWKELFRRTESDRNAKVLHIGNIESELEKARAQIDALLADQQSRIAEKQRIVASAEESGRSAAARIESIELDRENWKRLYTEAEADRVAKIAHISNVEIELHKAKTGLDDLLAAQAAHHANQEQLSARIAELTEHTRNMEEALAAARRDLDLLRQDQASRISLMSEASRHLESVEKDRANWRDLYEKAEADRVQKIGHIHNVEVALERAESAAAELRSDQANRISEQQRLAAVLEETQTVVRTLSSQRDDLQMHTNGIEADRDRLTEQIVAIRQEHQARLEQIQNELAETRRKREELEQLHLGKVEEAARLSERLALYEQELEASRADRSEWILIEGRLKAEIARSMAEVEQWRDRTADEQAARRSMEDRLAESAMAAGRSEEARRVLADRLEETGADLAKARDELTRVIGAGRREVESLQEQVESLRAATESREQELARKDDHIRRIESLLSEIWSSRTWRLLRAFDKLLGRATPPSPPGHSAGSSGSPAPSSYEPETTRHSVSTSGGQAAQRLRILQTVHFFLPRHYAGSELYTYYLCKELQKNHDVKLLLAEHNLSVPQYTVVDGEYDGIPYREITNNFHYESFEETYSNPRIDGIFEQLLDELRPDVIHFQHLLNLSTGMIGVARKRGIPTVFTLHDYWLTCPTGGQRFRDGTTICADLDLNACSECFQKSDFWASGIERRVFSLAQKLGPAAASGIYKGLNAARIHAPAIAKAAVAMQDSERPSLVPQLARRLDTIREAAQQVSLFVTPSQFARDLFIDFGIPAEKIVCLPNGHAPFGTSIHRPSTVFRAGFIGTIARHKGVHVLIEALRHLPSEAFEVRIFGETTIFPDYVQELERAAEGLPVRFMGKVENTAVADAFAELDVLVVPSIWWENSPLTIHEAFMAHLPVVAAAIGGLPELVRPGTNGLLFTPGSAVDLAEKLMTLRDNPDLVHHLRNRVNPVKTIEENACELEQLYRSLMA
ncbi:MAG: glycosyltransferase [Acidobacteria bacterium]|nr:glycosyltransferase [Acidobacteriota bacterium]